VVTTAGCAATASRPFAPIPAGAAPSADRLADALLLRERALATMRGQARLDYESPAQSFRSSQMVAVRAPASIRIDVMNPFGVSYSVATDGERVSAYDRREKAFYEGRAEAESFERFLGVAIGAPDLAALLRGLPPEIGLARGEGPVVAAEGGWLWSGADEGGAAAEMLVAEGTLHPVRVRFGAGVDGTQRIEAEFGDYRDIGGVAVAHRIVVRFAGGGQLQLRYSFQQSGVALGDDAFRLVRPEGIRAVDIDAEAAHGV
jgi:hypothetical protein